MKAQEQVERLKTFQESLHEIANKVLSLGDGSVMLNDVAEGKKQIADAINIKGGSASADSAFSQLANDVLAMPTSGIWANGVTQTKPFSFMRYVTSVINNEITEINDSEITTISRPYAFYNNIALREVVMSSLATISGDCAFQGCSSLQNIELPNLATISGDSAFQSCSSLQSVQLPNLVAISGGRLFYKCANLVEIRLPKLEIFSGIVGIIGDNFILQNIEFGVLSIMSEPFHNTKPNLRNITIGQDTNINLPFQQWTATNVIAEGQTAIDELNNNLYNNLLTKLYDHSEDGQTRTLRLGWLAHVTQENIDYANSKGWTLTT